MAGVTREGEALADAMAGNVRIRIVSGLFSWALAHEVLARNGVPMMGHDKNGALRAKTGAIHAYPDAYDDMWVVLWRPDEEHPE